MFGTVFGAVPIRRKAPKPTPKKTPIEVSTSAISVLSLFPKDPNHGGGGFVNETPEQRRYMATFKTYLDGNVVADVTASFIDKSFDYSGDYE